ncbi:hypothetical protein [Acinetobacter genomosp. 15BJ]|uniref:Uncharacterized protein n=1 Tax=Acinetobacter genomosp. 15BJ TaxID=106651 RepID=A0ABT8US35_9GAMM|nr:hypothetical protein [Acinetobacter genomosp. 15BJ]MCH7291788.1 hypothetical protein [Acinetobacter genomosp. 15BJ]MDO3655855.1 hypothetical protein [Acinetobacter genomosp. 15BJ]
MNRHRLKLSLASALLQLLAPILSCGLLLQLRRMMMRRLPFIRLQSQVSNVV